MRKLGIVFGGGGSSFFVHLGVLSVLEEENVNIHHISASSTGAAIGVMTALGMKSSEQYKFLMKIAEKPIIFKSLMEKRGHRRLSKILDRRKLEDLDIPLSLITTEICEGRQIIIEKGDVLKSMKISMAHPLISPPILHKGMHLFDGGLVNNNPADVARKKVGPEGIVLTSCLSIGKGKKPSLFYSVVPRMLRIIYIPLEIEREKTMEDNSNIILKPLAHIPFTMKNWWNAIFSFNNKLKNKKLYALGRRVMQQELPRLKQLISG